MIIAITGGRDREPGAEEMRQFWDIWKSLASPIEEVIEHGSAHTLIHGDARGTDRWVAGHVHGDGYKVVAFPVDQNLDGPWPAAGHRRNYRMLTESKAGALIAFPGGHGTAGCTTTARTLGLPVFEITAGPPPRKGRGDGNG